MAVVMDDVVMGFGLIVGVFAVVDIVVVVDDIVIGVGFIVGAVVVNIGVVVKMSVIK